MELNFVMDHCWIFMQNRGSAISTQLPDNLSKMVLLREGFGSLKEAARTMLAEGKVAQKYWAEAVNTAYYTQNRSIINTRFNKTPYEVFKGRKPSLSHLRIFGCPCYVHNNGKSNLKSFDPKSDEGVFLGYGSPSHQAYRILNLTSMLWK